MRINEQKTYIMYLSVEEFEMILPYAETIPFGYCFYKNSVKDEEGEYIVKADGEMLDELMEALKDKVNYLKYEECNRTQALEVQGLLNDMYYELNY